jgi:hypothetical protein
MASLNGRMRRLEGRAGTSKGEGAKHGRTEERRAEIIAELEALEARVRSMSETEREAWRNDPRRQAALRNLEEQYKRRRRGGV